MNIKIQVPILLRQAFLVLTVFLFACSLSLPQLQAADPQPTQESGQATSGSPPPSGTLPMKPGDGAPPTGRVGPPPEKGSDPGSMPPRPGLAPAARPRLKSDPKAAERPDEWSFGRNCPRQVLPKSAAPRNRANRSYHGQAVQDDSHADCIDHGLASARDCARPRLSATALQSASPSTGRGGTGTVNPIGGPSGCRSEQAVTQVGYNRNPSLPGTE